MNHPHIIELLHHSDSFLVLGYAENGELFDFISAPSKPFSEQLARTYFVQLVNAIDYCHERGIVHRDLKLENLLLDHKFNLKIADWGFSTKVKRGEKLDRILGTETYMAPEMLKRERYYGEQVDVFACGVILFCMIAGFPPYYKKANKIDPYYK